MYNFQLIGFNKEQDLLPNQTKMNNAERKRKALKSISLSQKIQLVCSSTASRTIRSGERGAILFANQSTRHYILIKYKERRDKMDESTEKFQVGGGGVIFN